MRDTRGGCSSNTSDLWPRRRYPKQGAALEVSERVHAKGPKRRWRSGRRNTSTIGPSHTIIMINYRSVIQRLRRRNARRIEFFFFVALRFFFFFLFPPRDRLREIDPFFYSPVLSILYWHFGCIRFLENVDKAHVGAPDCVRSRRISLRCRIFSFVILDCSLTEVVNRISSLLCCY